MVEWVDFVQIVEYWSIYSVRIVLDGGWRMAETGRFLKCGGEEDEVR
jgi:hypothetical protein